LFVRSSSALDLAGEPLEPGPSAARDVVPTVGVLARPGAAEVVVGVGDPAQVIAEEVARADVELLVIGRGRATAWTRWFRTPLHQLVLRATTVPVLVVSANERERGARPERGATPYLPTREPARPVGGSERPPGGSAGLVVLTGGRDSTRDGVG